MTKWMWRKTLHFRSMLLFLKMTKWSILWSHFQDTRSAAASIVLPIQIQIQKANVVSHIN